MDGAQKFGEGELYTRIKLSTRNEFRTLADSFNEMAERIVRAQDELVIKERMQKELEIAREIQATLIPKNVFQPGGYDVGIYYEPATEVGGDYIDVIPVDSDRLVMVMADVAGKGVPGLVVMAMLKVMVHALVGRASSPADLLKELNVSIKKTIRPNMFVTLFVGILETKSGEFAYSNAGHNPLVIYDRHRKKCWFHKMAGPPLGIFPTRVFDKEIAEYRMRIEPGVLILQYTDGLNESTNGQGQRFGLERIMSICEAYGSDGATSLVPRLARAEQTFRKGSSQMDDIALLALGAKDTVALHQARRAS
jgi:sigma-B regulation protein RsbU (phosphoserine phosphatase)